MANETEIERLVVRLIGDATGYTTMMQQSGQAVDKTTAQVQRHVRMLDSFKAKVASIVGSMAGWAAMAGGMIGVGSFAAAGAGAIKLAADLETTSIAFEVMLGSAQKAATMLEQIRVYAAQTPFEQAPLRQSAQMLMNYGIAAENIMPTLKMLGEVSAGDQNKLNGLAYAFAQMSAKGKVTGDDLRQMVNWGFNPLQEMSRTTGKSMAELTNMMHKGQITIQMLNDAFKSASSAGGRFFGMMDKQSKTLGGLFSTLKDDVSYALTQVGTILIEHLQLKEVIRATSAFIGKYTETFVGGLKYAFAVVKNIYSNGIAWMITQWNGFLAVLGKIQEIIQTNVAPALDFLLQKFGGISGTFEAIMANANLMWSYLQSGFLTVAGFIANFSENISIYWKYIGDNWMNVWRDMVKIVPIFASNMLTNMSTAVNTLFRLFYTLEGFIVQLFTNLFSHKVLDAVLTGLILVGEKIRQWATAAWETISSIFSGKKPAEALEKFMQQAQADFQQGMESTDILKDLQQVLKDGAQELVNPLEGFESSIEQLPQFNLEFKNLLDVPIEQTKKNLEDFGAVAGMKIGDNIGVGIKAARPFDAAIAGSKEAAEHIASYQEGLMRKPNLNPQQQQQKTNQTLDKISQQFQTLIDVTRDNLGESPVVLEFNAANLA